MNKTRKVVKLKDLPHDAIQVLMKKYPDGLEEDHVRKITKPNGEYFYAVDVETETVSYLVKIDVELDQYSDEETLDLDFIDEKAEMMAKKQAKAEADPEEEDEV